MASITEKGVEERRFFFFFFSSSFLSNFVIEDDGSFHGWGIRLFGVSRNRVVACQPCGLKVLHLSHMAWFRREAEERRGGWLAWGIFYCLFFVLALVHGVVSKNVGSLFFILMFLRSIYPHWILGVSLFNCRLSRALLFAALEFFVLLYIYLKGGG